MVKLKNNKQGQNVDLLFAVIAVLVIAIVIVVGFRVAKQLNTSVQNIQGVPQEAKDITQNVETHYVEWMDALFLVLFLFVCIILIASAFFIDTHPVFFIIALFVVIISAFVGGHLANAYSEFEQDMPNEAPSFSIIPYIFKHYITIIVVVGMLTLIALFAKLRST